MAGDEFNCRARNSQEGVSTAWGLSMLDAFCVWKTKIKQQKINLDMKCKEGYGFVFRTKLLCVMYVMLNFRLKR